MTSGSHLTEPDTGAAVQPQLPGGLEPAALFAVITGRSPVNDLQQLVIAAPPWDGSFGALLRACRRRGWLSQAQLAAQAHVSERTVRELEAGRVRSPRTDTVRLLADALQLSEPERAGWFAAAVAVNDQRAGPAAVRVDSPVRDAPSGQPPTARPWHGQQCRKPPLAAAGFQANGTRNDGRLSCAERHELWRLRRENRMLREDVEILKRAAAIFAASTR